MPEVEFLILSLALSESLGMISYSLPILPKSVSKVTKHDTNKRVRHGIPAIDSQRQFYRVRP